MSQGRGGYDRRVSVHQRARKVRIRIRREVKKRLVEGQEITVVGICEALEIGRGTFYEQFETSEGVVKQLQEESRLWLRARLEKSILRTPSIEGQLHAFAEELRESCYLGKQQVQILLMMTLPQGENSLSTMIAQLLRAVWRRGELAALRPVAPLEPMLVGTLMEMARRIVVRGEYWSQGTVKRVTEAFVRVGTQGHWELLV